MSIQDSLTTIRTAHRYVAAYQQRVRDIVESLDQALGMGDFELQFRGWNDDNTLNPARSGSRLRMAFVSIYGSACWSLNSTTENIEGNTWCWLGHVADTAMEEWSEKSPGREPDPLQDFRPASDSKSLLQAHWFKILKKLPASTWNKSWEKLVPLHFGVPLESVWPMNPTSVPVSVEKDGAIAGGMCVDIAELQERGDAKRLLIDPIVNEMSKLLGLR